ncbi:hypothetical protein PHYBLDRAFT_61424 [Phycomyces blakesleeanus NRRL 1555(-)]|uniref:Uncharacterized protein n=1 Tax=Phycomyces blakesleeanus (strain ATCC 8743b / DSM 1359 / FGSC 10004 / NBRC 33097 / NRRL 1555) TaxID=763407 RepID=A0A167QWA4_PHYB8|nr:hypothetical protein PHYBLDRAFT_61424 [Phycomyces blakesleeanus NRRL 1555(-)]OAD80374.1 hypothetical protein PHYBLDRAFT_61424 [Phycomyces blakesleeanus NRRL 1555(-)]|eukprot:XP_018298414.1 hypothetical protein PHYBLDRAFT_61424 [Phycomyces blakesleeanus NRRL 1555(-)]
MYSAFDINLLKKRKQKVEYIKVNFAFETIENSKGGEYGNRGDKRNLFENRYLVRAPYSQHGSAKNRSSRKDWIDSMNEESAFKCQESETERHRAGLGRPEGSIMQAGLTKDFLVYETEQNMMTTVREDRKMERTNDVKVRREQAHSMVVVLRRLGGMLQEVIGGKDVEQANQYCSIKSITFFYCFNFRFIGTQFALLCDPSLVSVMFKLRFCHGEWNNILVEQFCTFEDWN